MIQRTEASQRLERASVELQIAMMQHGLDSAEADRVREEMDLYWLDATEEEHAILDGLSADLYQLSNEEILNPNPQEVGPDDLLHALRVQDGSRVLDLLREPSARRGLDEGKAVLMRARAYTWIDYDRAALAFYEHYCRRADKEDG